MSKQGGVIYRRQGQARGGHLQGKAGAGSFPKKLVPQMGQISPKGLDGMARALSPVLDSGQVSHNGCLGSRAP